MSVWEKTWDSAYRGQYCLRLQASTGELGMYPLWVNGTILVAVETVYPAKAEVLTVWPFTEKVC